MSQQILSTAFLTVISGLLVANCTVDESHPEPDEAGSLAVEKGTVGGRDGIVRIEIQDGGGCTGTIIHPRMLLTAAHCVKAQTQSSVVNHVTGNGTKYRTGKVYMRVQGKGENGTSTICHSSNGSCNEMKPFWFVILDYTSDSDFGDDVAFVYRAHDFNNAPKTYPGLYTGALNTSVHFTVYGAGITNSGGNSGKMRFFSSFLDSVKSKYIASVAGNSRLCHGDSGGPWMKGKAMIGISSAVTVLTPNASCAIESPFPWLVGSDQHAYRIRKNTIDWINWALDTITSSPDPDMTGAITDTPRCVLSSSAYHWDCSDTFVAPSSEEVAEQKCVDSCVAAFIQSGLTSDVEGCIQGC